MSKKLLTNNYSKDGLMPVMNGLICWLDGRDYDGTNSVKDRVNKKIFTCNNTESKKNAFVYDKIDSTIFAEFNNNEAMYNLFNSDFTLCFEDKLDRTIVNANTATHSAYPRLIHFNDFSINSPYQLSYNGERHLCNRMTIQDGNIVSNDVLINVSINDNLSKKTIVLVKKGNAISVYLNGKKYETIPDNKNTIVNLERLTLGNVYLANRAYYGNIYSFMAYNRALTEEEIQQNYLYEQSVDREVYVQNITEWDYEKTSEQPILIQGLCAEYLNGANINLDTLSNNQIVEVDIQSVTFGNNDPQIMLLCNEGIGGKVYWGRDGMLKMGSDANFALKLDYPARLRFALINNTCLLYINDILQNITNVFESVWLPFAGVQLEHGGSIRANGFRYKKFD